jgi:hypothetical protein
MIPVLQFFSPQLVIKVTPAVAVTSESYIVMARELVGTRIEPFSFLVRLVRWTSRRAVVI